MKFYYSDFDSNLEMGDLIKWKDLPIGSYAGMRSWHGTFYGKFPSVISKPEWLIDSDHRAATYIQGITFEIDPNQYVMYLGMMEDAEKRAELLRSIDNNKFPMENVR